LIQWDFMVKIVDVEKAIGKKIAHDIIQYGPKMKAVIFKRGHVVKKEDIEKLKNAGNYRVYVEDDNFNGIHEDEAALRLMKAAAGKNTFVTRPNKGRVNLISKISGIARINVEAIKQVNLIKNFILVTVKDWSPIKQGQVIASGKIVPLSLKEEEIKRVENLLKKSKPVVGVLPPRIKKIAALITGTEVYEGRIKDGFLPALNRRFNEFGLKVSNFKILPDDPEKIKNAILLSKRTGNDLILVCGGMAVDVDDVTAKAIKMSRTRIISRGVPVFPGAMLLIGYLGDTPVLGLPACVIPDKITSFDLLLPKILLGRKMTKKDLIELAHGGLL